MAHPWQGLNIYCNSKNTGVYEEVRCICCSNLHALNHGNGALGQANECTNIVFAQVWYPDMGPSDTVVLGASLSEGDEIEVRLMADQASSNEDVAITSLRMTVNASQTYPYHDGAGWVIFAEDEDSITVGIDPSVSGACPGGYTLEQGYDQLPICSRALTAAGGVSASYEVPFDVGTVEIDLSYSQYYSAGMVYSVATGRRGIMPIPPRNMLLTRCVKILHRCICLGRWLGY